MSTLTDGNLNSIDSEAERIMLESPETSVAYHRAKNTRTLVQEFRVLIAKHLPPEGNIENAKP